MRMLAGLAVLRVSLALGYCRKLERGDAVLPAGVCASTGLVISQMHALMAPAAREQQESVGWKLETGTAFSLFPPNVGKRRRMPRSEVVAEVETL